MKEYFLSFVIRAIWGRRKHFYYAVTAISIAGNLVLLVGPTVQPSILPYVHVLQTFNGLSKTASFAIGSLQTAFHAASAMGALQMRAWGALPHFAELVMQRSVLYILLNLILARIVFKSGVLAEKTSSQPASMKLQEELSAVNNLKIVCGSHWLAPSYLQTVYSTMSNFVDASAGSSSLPQHAHQVHSRGNAETAYALKPRNQVHGHPSVHYPHNHSPLQSARPLPANPAARSPSKAPSRPSLFTIEPLEELVQSMQQYQAPILEAQISMHTLRKVATKVDLLQAVRASRRKDYRPKADQTIQKQQKSGRTVQGVKEKHGIRRTKEHNMGQSMVQSNGRGSTMDGWRMEERDGDDDYQLSSQEFNERVDTFIWKFKRSLNMQRKDSVNRLLGLY